MTEPLTEPDVALEMEEMRLRNRDAVIRFILARDKYRELREGKSDLPPFPVDPCP